MTNDKTLRLVLVLYAVAVVVGIAALIPHGKSKSAARSRGSLAVLQIYGAIHTSTNPSPWASPDADEIVRKLHRLADDDDVKAIVLRINSPGGTVGATQEIYTEILRCKAKGKKVVASLGDVAASGGYYIASAADRIVADAGTITGSIGVILQFGNLEGLFQKFGVKLEVIKSGAHKDIGSPARALTSEERALLQASINDAYDQFVNAVATGRKLPMERVKPLADGRIFTGRQALELGLVDEIGNREEAIARAIALAGLPEHPTILKDGRRSLSSLIESLSSQGVSRIFGWALPGEDSAGPTMEYRWQ